MKKFDINSNLYGKFMARKGPHEGENSSVYTKAMEFFEAEDAKPKAPAASPGASSAVASSNVPATSAKAAEAPKGKAELQAEFERLVTIVKEMEANEEEEDEDAAQPEGKDMNCNTVRRRINELTGSGYCTQTRFLEIIGCNNTSFRRFMSYTGAYQGSDNGVYSSGRDFFTRLDKAKKAGKKAKAPRKALPTAAAAFTLPAWAAKAAVPSTSVPGDASAKAGTKRKAQHIEQ